MIEATPYRADVPQSVILAELMADCDLVMKVDCASQRVTFVVGGWFRFPRTSLKPPPSDLEQPA